jgi:hypothetical protein
MSVAFTHVWPLMLMPRCLISLLGFIRSSEWSKSLCLYRRGEISERKRHAQPRALDPNPSRNLS